MYHARLNESGAEEEKDVGNGANKVFKKVWEKSKNIKKSITKHGHVLLKVHESDQCFEIEAREVKENQNQVSHLKVKLMQEINSSECRSLFQ